jgi:3-oxoacyl-[acyl-carrier-protein] synthase II
MERRRAVITGVGAITPLGASLQSTIEALAAGRSAVAPATLFDAAGFACPLAAEVRDWDARPSFRAPKALKLTDRPARFAVAAAQMALADAAWPVADSAAGEDLGVVIGSSGSDLQARDIGRALAGDAGEAVERIDVFADRMLRGLNPLWLLVSLPNMTSAHVAIQVQARGPNSTIMSDWAAGQQAIGEAADWIASGEARAVLAGGADCGVQPFAYAAYEQMGLFASDGGARFVPVEGAAMLLVEERGAATAAGRRPLAEIAGYAATSSGDDALAHSLCEAMHRAGWTRGDVTACVVAAPPVAEWTAAAARAVADVLGDRPASLVFATGLGHPLAAAGPIDVARLVRTAAAGSRILTSAVGCSGEAVTLAIDVASTPDARTAPGLH